MPVAKRRASHHCPSWHGLLELEHQLGEGDKVSLRSERFYINPCSRRHILKRNGGRPVALPVFNSVSPRLAHPRHACLMLRGNKPGFLEEPSTLCST